MVLTYLKKRIKPDVPEAVIQEAVGAVQETKYSLRVAATRYGITHYPYNTVLQNLKKISNGDMCNQLNVFMSRYTSPQVFSENLELVLLDYIIKYPN